LSFIFNRLRGKNKDEILFKQSERLAVHSNENQNPGTDEYVELTNRAGFLITDEKVLELFIENKCLNSLVPIASPTNSVIKLSKHEADLKRVRIDNHICLLKLTMKPSLYNNNGLETLEGSRLFLHDRVSGAEEGWIGHIATETTRRHVFAEEKKRN
jgi:hypothetical protein